MHHKSYPLTPQILLDEGNCVTQPAARHVEFVPDANALEAIEHTKRICDGCPAKSECLEFALENRYVGTWGGTDEKERFSIRRSRTRRAARERAAREKTAVNQ